MVICQGFLHVWLSILSHGNSFARAVSSRQMATVHAPVPALSCSCYTVYLHTLQMQMYSMFSACAISPILPETSGSQCMNWPTLCNLHPQLLEIDEPYKIYLNIDLLCLLAVDLFGKNSHWPHCESYWNMAVSILVNKSGQGAFHGPEGRSMMLTLYSFPKTGWPCSYCSLGTVMLSLTWCWGSVWELTSWHRTMPGIATS